MELTSNQKISIRLAMKARIRYFEGLDITDDYVSRELAACRELYELLDNTLTINLDFFSDYEVAA
ncbi:hypothetical protein AB0G06_43565 [Nonomuraea dietziae]|uniref:hypothetical protein n=1 Tax=Nonomuraea dietziae TaxID=65515 RepID=UPI0033F7C064